MPLEQYSKASETKKSRRKSRSIYQAQKNTILDTPPKPWNDRANLYVSDDTSLPAIMIGKCHTLNEATTALPAMIEQSPAPQTHSNDNESIIPVVAPIVAIVVILFAACIFYTCRNKNIREDDKSDIGDKDEYEFNRTDKLALTDRLLSPRIVQKNNSYFSLNFPLPPQVVIRGSKGNNDTKDENASVYYDSLEYQDSQLSCVRQQPSPIPKPATILTHPSSAHTETLSSPDMTGKNSRVSSIILMTAERQHLHHALPTVLSHLTNP